MLPKIRMVSSIPCGVRLAMGRWRVLVRQEPGNWLDVLEGSCLTGNLHLSLEVCRPIHVVCATLGVE